MRIPVSTIRAFIIQIIGLNSHLNNIDITINKKGKWIFVNILCAYTGNMPVCQEMHKLKEVLRGEIKRVFEFPYLKINFQLDGINIDHTDNGSDDEIGQANQIEIEDEIEGEKVPEDEDLDTIPQPEGEPQDEDVIEDAVPPSAPKPKKRKGMPWER